MDFVVYNLISQDKRTVKITPSNTWGGDSLIGASIRYEDYSHAHRSVAYVSNVYENSPASKAGLVAKTDFILGNQFAKLTTLDDIGVLTRANLGREIELSVYSLETKQIRDLSIVPKENWGGNGLLGCELLMGVQFFIPSESTSEEEDDVETLDENLEGDEITKKAQEFLKESRKGDDNEYEIETEVIIQNIDEPEQMMVSNSQESPSSFPTKVNTSTSQQTHDVESFKNQNISSKTTHKEQNLTSEEKMKPEKIDNKEDEQIRQPKKAAVKRSPQYNPFLKNHEPEVKEDIDNNDSETSVKTEASVEPTKDEDMKNITKIEKPSENLISQAQPLINEESSKTSKSDIPESQIQDNPVVLATQEQPTQSKNECKSAVHLSNTSTEKPEEPSLNQPIAQIIEQSIDEQNTTSIDEVGESQSQHQTHIPKMEVDQVSKQTDNDIEEEDKCESLVKSSEQHIHISDEQSTTVGSSIQPHQALNHQNQDPKPQKELSENTSDAIEESKSIA